MNHHLYILQVSDSDINHSSSLHDIESLPIYHFSQGRSVVFRSSTRLFMPYWLLFSRPYIQVLPVAKYFSLDNNAHGDQRSNTN